MTRDNQGPSAPFEGRTDRGRIVRDDSLDACVDSLAFVMNRNAPDLVVVPVPGDENAWRIYADQAAVEVDAARDEPCNWIAFVRMDGAA